MCSPYRAVAACALVGLTASCSGDTAFAPDCEEHLLLEARSAASDDWRENLIAFAESPPPEFESTMIRGKYIVAVEPNTPSVQAFLAQLDGEITYEFSSWSALVVLLPLDSFHEVAGSELVTTAWTGAVGTLAGAGCI